MPFRLYDLRHTAASLLLADNVHPKIVQERLGHANIGLTLGTYSHLLATAQQKAVESLDRMFEMREPVEGVTGRVAGQVARYTLAEVLGRRAGPIRESFRSVCPGAYAP